MSSPERENEERRHERPHAIEAAEKSPDTLCLFAQVEVHAKALAISLSRFFLRTCMYERSFERKKKSKEGREEERLRHSAVAKFSKRT